jgi:hypothetical protein
MTQNGNGKFKLDRSEWIKISGIVLTIALAFGWRVVRLESAVDHMGDTIQDMKQDIRELRGRH